jgi:hypothetical protein
MPAKGPALQNPDLALPSAFAKKSQSEGPALLRLGEAMGNA